MIEVSTPTLMSLVEGMMRTAISAASSSARAGERARHQQPRRIVADQGPHQMRRDQADEADGAGDRDRAADAERDARNHDQPQPADIDAEALRGLLAQAERAKGMALAEQHDRAGDDERQRQHDVLKAAVLQRAEQPERDFQHHERIAGQVHHQRGRRARKARDRKARQNQNQQPGIAARDREQREHRGEGRHDRRDRQRVGAHIGKAERDHQHRAEGRRLRRAEQRGRGQRIAQQALQRRAGQPEDRADRKPQNRARQADFAHDHLLHVAAAAEQRIDHGQRRQPHRPDPERDQHQQHDEDDKRRHHADRAGAPRSSPSP